VSRPAGRRDQCAALYLEHDRPFVDLEFTRPDGRARAARFWVDTGGGGFILKESLAKELDIPAGRAGERGRRALRGRSRRQNVKIGGSPLDLKDARCLVTVGDTSSFAGRHVRRPAARARAETAIR
jgi:hypothetical protein